MLQLHPGQGRTSLVTDRSEMGSVSNTVLWYLLNWIKLSNICFNSLSQITSSSDSHFLLQVNTIYLFLKSKAIAACYLWVCVSNCILKWQTSLAITSWQSTLLHIVKAEKSKPCSKMFGCSSTRQLMCSKCLVGHSAKTTTADQYWNLSLWLNCTSGFVKQKKMAS